MPVVAAVARGRTQQEQREQAALGAVETAVQMQRRLVQEQLILAGVVAVAAQVPQHLQ